MRLPGEKCESTEKLNRDMPYSLCALCLCVFVVKFIFNRIRYTTYNTRARPKGRSRVSLYCLAAACGQIDKLGHALRSRAPPLHVSLNSFHK